MKLLKTLSNIRIVLSSVQGKHILSLPPYKIAHFHCSSELQAAKAKCIQINMGHFISFNAMILVMYLSL